MGKASDIFFIGIGIALLATICIIVASVILYNRYINKRLKGETKKKIFFNYKAFALVMAFGICAFTIGYMGISLAYLTGEWKSQQERLEQYENYPPNWSYSIDNFEKNPQYNVVRDGLVNGNLTGFEITSETDGDFECFVAFTTQRIDGLPSSLPDYYIYIRYTGADIEDIMMERHFYYNQDHTVGVGSGTTFRPELLIVGNFGRDDFFFGREDYYIEIETILKIAPQTQETKLNWNTLPIHDKSNFVISKNELTIR